MTNKLGLNKKISFTTPVQIPLAIDKINCDSRILTLGSCFSDHMGKKLNRHLFHALVNPFGTIFNPASLADLLDMVVSNKTVGQEDLNSVGDRYFHYDFHSSFDHTNPALVAQSVNESLLKTREYLPKSDFLILTFGTSIAYKLKSQNRIVSNCHKVPGHNFEKVFLELDFMVDRLFRTIDSIRMINPDIRLIFTVSPVRHTREGMVNNSRSKSRLIELCHKLITSIPKASYFPSYELMMDELRDYRFYKNDLIHPTDMAVDIIWSRFTNVYFDEKAMQKVEDMDALVKAREHNPFDPLSLGFKKFKSSQLEKINRYVKLYPEVNFQQLIDYFS